ncbi:branched-chain amino acid aminotransferase [Tsukamurella serpentis]
MTTGTTFALTRNDHPRSAAERSEILANPGFGRHFTDHMVSLRWSEDSGWHDAEVLPYGPITLQPSASVLHYAQEIFEGLKAYRQPDGTVATFRPEANAARFQRSAERLAIPPLPEDVFVEALEQLVAVDGEWVPAAGGEEALYFRPFIFADEQTLGVKPANSYRFLVIASPAGAYFAGGVKPVSVWLSREYVRAVPGGTGFAKCGGNYAASLVAQAQAAQQGCDQVVWLDAIDHEAIEEMGGMNLFFVLGSGSNATIVTPELTGSLLPGVTRDSLLQLARDAGLATEERRITVTELTEGVASGAITEVFACGTAAVITPVGRVQGAKEDFLIGDGEPGAITLALREKLTGIQRGTVPDTHGWMHTLG